MNRLFASVGQSIGASGLISFKDWLVWFPGYPRHSQESSPVPQFESISSSVLSLVISLFTCIKKNDQLTSIESLRRMDGNSHHFPGGTPHFHSCVQNVYLGPIGFSLFCIGFWKLFLLEPLKLANFYDRFLSMITLYLLYMEISTWGWSETLRNSVCCKERLEVSGSIWEGVCYEDQVNPNLLHSRWFQKMISKLQRSIYKWSLAATKINS